MVVRCVWWGRGEEVGGWERRECGGKSGLVERCVGWGGVAWCGGGKRKRRRGRGGGRRRGERWGGEERVEESGGVCCVHRHCRVIVDNTCEFQHSSSHVDCTFNARLVSKSGRIHKNQRRHVCQLILVWTTQCMHKHNLVLRYCEYLLSLFLSLSLSLQLSSSRTRGLFWKILAKLNLGVSQFTKFRVASCRCCGSCHCFAVMIRSSWEVPNSGAVWGWSVGEHQAGSPVEVSMWRRACSGRLTTHELARKEAINYLRAKQTWTPGTADPMDLPPLGKGKGGKKGKSKGKGDKTPRRRCNQTKLDDTLAWKWTLKLARGKSSGGKGWGTPAPGSGCHWNPRSEEQMADRHAVASGEDERQHDDNRKRDIHIAKRGSETDKLRKTVSFEPEAQSTLSSSTMHVSLEYLASSDLSIFWKFVDGTIFSFATKIDRKSLLMRTNRGCWSFFPNRDPFLVTQHLPRHSASSDQQTKILMSLREGLHVMMQCYMRQHIAVVTGCMNIQEDMHRGENPRWGKKQRISAPTVGESH